MRKILIITLAFSFVACKYFQGDSCNNTKPLIGTYENIYDKSAKNILIIKEDGTFEQVFTKGKISKKKIQAHGSFLKKIVVCFLKT